MNHSQFLVSLFLSPPRVEVYFSCSSHATIYLGLFRITSALRCGSFLACSCHTMSSSNMKSLSISIVIGAFSPIINAALAPAATGLSYVVPPPSSNGGKAWVDAFARAEKLVVEMTLSEKVSIFLLYCMIERLMSLHRSVWLPVRLAHVQAILETSLVLEYPRCASRTVQLVFDLHLDIPNSLPVLLLQQPGMLNLCTTALMLWAKSSMIWVFMLHWLWSLAVPLVGLHTAVDTGRAGQRTSINK